ncbi:MAG TPA: ABC transporter permease subunit [Verrucomicrobiae bacterium]|nr:ABC transporter permease subunit [Verrucomicrobiae bacterium]
MRNVFAIAGVVIKELYRRKDFYVLFVLTALITLAAAAVHFFHEPNIVRYVKDLCLLLIWIAAWIITIATAARQIPMERESRTIFPLLAKPVTRGQVVLGKFFGCWFASGIALLFFYLFFIVVTGSREHYWPIMEYVQAILLQWVMLGMLTALTLWGSIIFAAPSSTVTIVLVAIFTIWFLGPHLRRIGIEDDQPMFSVAYFIIPHLEFFDLRERLVGDWGLVPWGACGLAVLYAAAYTGLFLLLTWLGFRRKNLST